MKAAVLLLVVASAVACGRKNAESSSLAGEVNQRGYDVTVLQAWLGEHTQVKINQFVTSKYDLDPNNCVTLRDQLSDTLHDGRKYWYVTKQCDAELERVAKLPGFDQVSPLLNSTRFDYDRVEGGDNYTKTGLCEMVEYRTVTRDAALHAPTFKGLGFYLSSGNSGDGNLIMFVDKARLHAVGKVLLTDGAPATVHRFISRGMCFGTGGNGGSIANRRYDFRPFARYEDGGNTYNVWDHVPTDFRLGRTTDAGYTFVKTFDRQSELLKP